MMDEGALRVMQGFGKFLPMPSFAPYVYEKVRAKEAEARSTSAVIRTEVQISPNGDSVDEMPPPTPTKSNQAEKVRNLFGTFLKGLKEIFLIKQLFVVFVLFWLSANAGLISAILIRRRWRANQSPGVKSFGLIVILFDIDPLT